MRDLIPIADRLRWLRRFRDAVKSHNPELCALASEEVGKTGFEALTADIILEHRSFAEWLFEPILAIRGRL